MTPNPLKQIQEAVEKVLHDTGIVDFGRSVSSIDDLTAEVQHVYKRVDDIEQRIETIVPLLERLVNVAEGLEREIQPISSLAAKVPGSGSRKRRREQAAEQLGPGSGDAAAEDVAADRITDAPTGPIRPHAGSVPQPASAPTGGHGIDATGPGVRGASRPGATATPGAPTASPGPHRDASIVPSVTPPSARPDAPPTTPSPTTDLPSGGAVRPGATGYAPLGNRPRPRD